MAKKAELLKEAKNLGVEISAKNTIAQIEAAIKLTRIKTADNIEPASSGKNTSEHEKVQDKTENKLAKAGRKSRKGVEEAVVKAEKEARKRGETDDSSKDVAKPKKGPAPKARTHLERRGKKYREAYTKIDRNKSYDLAEAMQLSLAASTSNFDATIELHIRLNVDPKQSDQNIRDIVNLPHGTGKSLRVAVFAPDDKQEAAKKAGADIVGEKDFLTKLDKSELDFDVLISTPQVMSQLGKYAKLLGPKGLMPNPKSGTVTNNVVEAVKAAKTGRVEFRVDPQGIVHVGIGKVSFGAEKLVENAKVVLDAVKAAKPASVKSGYVISVFATSSMGPSVRVSI